MEEYRAPRTPLFSSLPRHVLLPLPLPLSSFHVPLSDATSPFCVHLLPFVVVPPSVAHDIPPSSSGPLPLLPASSIPSPVVHGDVTPQPLVTVLPPALALLPQHAFSLLRHVFSPLRHASSLLLVLLLVSGGQL